MSVDLAWERDLEYMADEKGEVGPDFWWARCLDGSCDYEFQTTTMIEPLCPNCCGDAEVV